MEEEPDPYFPYADFGVGYDYSPSGMVVGGRVSKEVTNRGGAGDVFVKVTWVNRGENVSKVFYMDEGESVLLEAYFAGIRPGTQGVDKYTWTARPALSGDASQGEMTVIRSTVKRLSHFDLGPMLDVAVVDDYAYIIVGDWGRQIIAALHIVDLKDPFNPKEVGQYSFAKSPAAFSEYNIDVMGDYAYVTIGHSNEDDENGLHIIDISDRSKPEKVGEYLTGEDEQPCDIALTKNYAYIITEGLLLVIDGSDPLNPQEIGQYKINDAESIAIENGYAYILGRYQLNVIDVSIPDQIKEVANKTYQFQLYSVQGKVITSGNYAFAVIKDGSLLVFDVTIQSNHNRRMVF